MIAPAAVQPAGDFSALASNRAQASPQPVAQAPQTAVAPPAVSDVRLLIEEVGHSHGFVYKLVDSVTGATLSEIPREQIADLQQDSSYAVGAVISTTV